MLANAAASLSIVFWVDRSIHLSHWKLYLALCNRRPHRMQTHPLSLLSVAVRALSAWPAVSGQLPPLPPSVFLRVPHVSLPLCAFRARFFSSPVGSCDKSAALMAVCSNIGAHALSTHTAVLSRVSVCCSAHSSHFARRPRKSRLVASLQLRSLFRLYSCSHSRCCDFVFVHALEPVSTLQLDHQRWGQEEARRATRLLLLCCIVGGRRAAARTEHSGAASSERGCTDRRLQAATRGRPIDRPAQDPALWRRTFRCALRSSPVAPPCAPRHSRPLTPGRQHRRAAEGATAA